MALRIFRSVWLLSVVAILAALLYHYASLPEEVIIGQQEIYFISFARDTFFYILVAILTFINVTVFVAKKYARKSEEFQSWFYGFIAVINFFLIIALSFVSLFNSNESFRFNQIGFIVYGSMLLIGAWIVGGLAYWQIQKLRLKNS